VTDRFPLTIGGLTSNGTDTGSNSETYWPVTRDTQSVALAYSNIWDWSGTGATNSITIRASVKAFGGWVPVFFNGKRDVVIEPDGLVVSDPTGAPLAAGSLLPVRTRVTVNSGEKWPNHTLTDATAGEGVENGTATTDKTLTGTIATGRTYGPAPFTVLADPGITGDARTLVGVGDSIMQQQHDAINNSVSSTSTLQWGFVRRYTNPNKIPFLNLALIGDTARDYAALSGRKYAYRRGAAADGGVAIVNFGRNDLDQGRTLAQIQADLVTVWTSMARRGIKVYQATVCPKTTSTDKWGTTAGQTVVAEEPIRVALNDWIRTTPAPLSGYFETADTVETARNSGIWKPALRRVTDAAITSGATTLTSATANFTAADIGRTVNIAGAGASGAILTVAINAVASATSATVSAAAGTTVSGAVADIGTYTDDGIHPVATGHIAMAGALDNRLKLG
jgi:lysophospholipase L1-like esterase